MADLPFPFAQTCVGLLRGPWATPRFSARFGPFEVHRATGTRCAYRDVVAGLGKQAKRGSPFRVGRPTASWFALLAAATLGAASIKHVRARVVSPAAPASAVTVGPWRLIVQSYHPRDLTPEGQPRDGARPLASTQRAVTPELLRRGVPVDLIELEPTAEGAPVVVAWLERGAPDLEFDARRARPGAAAYIGVGRDQGDPGPVQVALERAHETPSTG